MAVTIKWAVPEAVASVMTTELNGITANSLAISTNPIANRTGLYKYMSLELYLGSVAHGGNSRVEVWFAKELDGTNYENGSVAYRRPPAVIFRLRNAVTAAQRVVLNNIPIPACAFKTVIRNGCDVTFAGTTNTLKYSRYYEQAV
jgi:hypothetical protein